MSSKRYSSLLLTALFISSTAAANAGSKSMLDPYAAVQAPSSKKPKPIARPASQDVTESTHTTYISMPMPAEEAAKAKANGGGKFGGLFGGKKEKVAKAPKPEKVAEAPAEKGDGIAAKSLDSVKSAGSTIVGGTKAAGSKIAEGSKAVGGGIATGAKKVGGGIASGAKVSGDYLMKGVHAIGHGFKSTGEKVKEGAGSAGSKVAGLPKLWGKKGAAGGGQEKAKQEAIAKAVAERKAAQQGAAQPEIAKDSEWNSDPVANRESKPVPIASPGQQNTVGFQALQQQASRGQSKGGGITGGFSKAIGKLNPFGGKSNTAVHPVVRPQSMNQSTAATQEAIPQ